MSDFSKYGPWAIITGASAGLGEEFAVQLAEKGINLVLVARRKERLEELGKKLSEQHGIETRAVAADLSAEDFMDTLGPATEGLEVGLLINNAGFTNSGNLLDNDLAAEVRLVHVNMRAPLILAHHYGQQMRERRRGGMIFLASIAGFAAIPFWTNYSASKSWDLFVAEGLGAELKKDGIDVLALCPGATRTEFETYSGVIAKLMVMESPAVVRTGLNALGRKRTVVAGFLNRMNVFLTRFMPRKLNSVLFGFVVRDIVDH